MIEKTQQCRDCMHFVNDALSLEKEIKGLSIVSSALGSVRAETGLCRLMDIFVVPQNLCEQYICR